MRTNKVFIATFTRTYTILKNRKLNDVMNKVLEQIQKRCYESHREK